MSPLVKLGLLALVNGLQVSIRFDSEIPRSCCHKCMLNQGPNGMLAPWASSRHAGKVLANTSPLYAAMSTYGARGPME